MGVPSFFRWLTMRNPLIVKEVDEAAEAEQSNNPLVDNFYVDMNGLIHPACNPQQQGVPYPTCFEEQCRNIAAYLDRLINIVRPGKILYLAVDGVAPRAKMIQQRSRRFRAAMEHKTRQETTEKLLQKFKNAGAYVQSMAELAKGRGFDSNVITPGTEFLFKVCQFIASYVKERLESHDHWRNLTVVFSDANVPGEGEHKIMEFIRQQRSAPFYPSNVRHCLYGADADLLMLGLATHEPIFYVIRESVVTEREKHCTACGKPGHFFFECSRGGTKPTPQRCVDFQYIQLRYFREYIRAEIARLQTGFKLQTERVVDDFNFICIIVGNDFLPHLPYLSIREGGIDLLFFLYKELLAKSEDYLTCEGKVNFPVLHQFLQLLARAQPLLLDEQRKREDNDYRRGATQYSQTQEDRDRALFRNLKDQKADQRMLLERFKTQLNAATSSQPLKQKPSSGEWQSAKEKYYRCKFKIEPDQFIEFRKSIRKSYLEALAWVCAYYNQGCCSWSWFFPFHYAPFVSDLLPVADFVPQFELAAPFRPIEQLLSVLPPRSSGALPQFLRPLMHQSSILGDLFPTNFEIDLEGKKFAWLGQVLIPFIEEARILEAMKGYEQRLSEYETIRNQQRSASVLTMKDFGSLVLTVADHGLDGTVAEVKQSNKQGVRIYQFKLSARRHHTAGKMIEEQQSEGELDDDYLQKTDKRGFQGERMVRLGRKALGLKENFGTGSRAEWSQFHSDALRRRERSRERESGRRYRN